MLNNLAVSLEALGRYEDALATYKKALEKSPTNTAHQARTTRGSPSSTPASRAA